MVAVQPLKLACLSAKPMVHLCIGSSFCHSCCSNPDDDSQLSLSAEAGVPVSKSWLKFLRLRGRVDKPVPLICMLE